MTARGTAIVAEMPDVRRRVGVRMPAANAVLRVGSMLQGGRGRAEDRRLRMSARARAPPPTSARRGSSALTTSVVHSGKSSTADLASARRRARALRSGRVGHERGFRARPRAVAFAGSPREAHPRPPRTDQGRHVRLDTRDEASPESRFAPARFQASRCSSPRIFAAIAVVVVFPFVAEISATPEESRAASASTEPGSSFQRSFPGKRRAATASGRARDRTDSTCRDRLDGEAGSHRRRG